jgi:hypothetical protein
MSVGLVPLVKTSGKALPEATNTTDLNSLLINIVPSQHVRTDALRISVIVLKEADI